MAPAELERNDPRSRISASSSAWISLAFHRAHAFTASLATGLEQTVDTSAIVSGGLLQGLLGGHENLPRRTLTSFQNSDP
ncbi:hypothetical protein CC1G_15090 [Coprinopsis cinerea okayama7|uniref:Uncharacterized protein n=1 Tax=Coprinopsis cinerea (strain Okayama-7 / 130 / ATCC MYA-4618 / FGSC 9003) TaxID=240176 RepID=D6RPF7_COPC7|nr:hypothetical protein CC1G_15090 [Coprinopsis cinerea okayama7\|eukprot:XP_002910756.1 hypothetical protein CC1G_15090 [Coprinopsis cinerea okayama7\